MNDNIPEEFKKVVKDFYKDILTTFPECKDKLGPSEVAFLTDEVDPLILFEYCKNNEQQLCSQAIKKYFSAQSMSFDLNKHYYD